MNAVARHSEVESSTSPALLVNTPRAGVVSVVASLVVSVVASLVAIGSAARALVRHRAAICGLRIFPTSLPDPGGAA